MTWTAYLHIAVLALDIATLLVLAFVSWRLRTAMPALKIGPRFCERCVRLLPEGSKRTHDGHWLCAACKGRTSR